MSYIWVQPYLLEIYQGNNRVVINQSGAVQQVNHDYPFGGFFVEGVQTANQPSKAYDIMMAYPTLRNQITSMALRINLLRSYKNHDLNNVMMKYIVLMISSILLLSCKVQIRHVNEGIYTYHHESTDDKEELILNSDSTFIFNSYKISCSGMWEYKKPNIIIIKCSDVNLIDKIQSGYMTQRIRQIKILSNNRLKLPITNNVKMKYVILIKEE